MMRQPRRDERWNDPEGNTWQVTQVNRWRLEPKGRYEFASAIVRHPATGENMKVPAHRWRTDWTQDSLDPLAGHRKRIAQAVRAGSPLFTLPASTSIPPVAKGEMYHLTCGQIVIDNIAKQIVGGQAEWHVRFTRLLTDRLYFLRSTVPAANPDELVKAPTATDIEYARIDGNYRTEPEHGGDPLPCVPPDWVERGAVSRSELFTANRHRKRKHHELKQELHQAEGPGARARIRNEINQLRAEIKDAA